MGSVNRRKRKPKKTKGVKNGRIIIPDEWWNSSLDNIEWAVKESNA